MNEYHGSHLTHSINALGRAILERVQVLDVWRLEILDIHEVRPHDLDAIDVEPHPDPVAERGEHHLEVDVVTENEPEAEHGLEEHHDVHGHDPREEKAADIGANSDQEQEGEQRQEGEVEHRESAGTLQCVFKIGFEKWQPELRRVASCHDVDAVCHDCQRHEEGVDGDG